MFCDRGKKSSVMLLGKELLRDDVTALNNSLSLTVQFLHRGGEILGEYHESLAA